MIFSFSLKYWIIKFIEKLPLLQIIIYNNLSKFKFLFPHDKDYLALKLLFKVNEKRDFIDVGGNIGLSVIGFRELGFTKNKILIFEPDIYLINSYLKKLNKYYKNLLIYKFGLSNKNEEKILFKAFYKNKLFHFNNSFDKNYIKNKIKQNYPKKFKQFHFNTQKFNLKKFDNLKLNTNACFVKIDVEGFDHKVIDGMKNFIKQNKPVLLIEYNHSNFIYIYKKIKIDYDCYRFDIEKNFLIKLNNKNINKLLKGSILEEKYSKNSVNLFYIHKTFKLPHFDLDIKKI